MKDDNRYTPIRVFYFWLQRAFADENQVCSARRQIQHAFITVCHSAHYIASQFASVCEPIQLFDPVMLSVRARYT